MDVHKLALFRQQSHEEILAAEQGNLLARMPASALNSKNGADAFFEWLHSAPVGSVKSFERNPYPSGIIYNSFTNTPVHGDEVTLEACGAELVHVAVGFVDLSTAAAAAAAAAASTARAASPATAACRARRRGRSRARPRRPPSARGCGGWKPAPRPARRPL